MRDSGRYRVVAFVFFAAFALPAMAWAQTPVVTIQATDPNASEVGPDTGEFTLTRTGSTTLGLGVTVTITGSAANNGDYNFVAANINFAAGSSTAVVTITPKNDASVEGPETVILTLLDGAQYDLGVDVTDTVTIADNAVPIVTISATDATASEVGLDPGEFTLTRVGDTTFALGVTVSITGTAANNGDYDFVAANINFAAGSSTAVVTITPKSDASVEGPETVILTLLDGAQYDLGVDTTDTVTIEDGPPPTTTSTSFTTSTSNASTTSTSTSSSSTSSTSSSTSSTSTSTLPPGACDDIPTGPTFESIHCRLEALLDAIVAEDGLGFLQPKLESKVTLLIQRADEAIEACRVPKASRVDTRLKQIDKGLSGAQHRLGTLKARKKVPEEIRQPFIDAGEPIKTDVGLLRESVLCPDDAPPL